MPGFKNRADALGDAMGGHFVEVAAEESCVVDTSLSGQRLDSRTGSQLASLLIETHMAVGAYAENLPINATSRLDCAFIIRPGTTHHLGILL